MSAVVEYFDRSLGYIPSLQIYCYVRGKLACTAIKLSASHCATAIKLLASHYATAIKLLASHYANIRIVCSHLRERPRTNIRPCHCEGVQIDPAIVWVVKVLNVAIVQVYSNNITQRGWIKTKLPAYLQDITDEIGQTSLCQILHKYWYGY